METLTPAQRRSLRAKAHHLHPVVSIGQHGLTAAVLREIDINLKAHELIKIRVFGDARATREGLMSDVCTALGAAPVQHLGKLLIVWRPAPVEEPAAPRASKPAPKSAAKKAPQARRPRSPLPRTPTRPPRSRGSTEAPAAPRERRRSAAGASTLATGGRRATPQGKSASSPKSGSVRRGAPHGKSASSLKGASGARRRRKAR